LVILLSFKFPTATGAVDAHGKPEEILFQKFMFNYCVALTATDFIAKVFSSMLIFYLRHNPILAQFQQFKFTAPHICIPAYFLVAPAPAFLLQ
jgi:hypothetical protein